MAHHPRIVGHATEKDRASEVNYAGTPFRHPGSAGNAALQPADERHCRPDRPRAVHRRMGRRGRGRTTVGSGPRRWCARGVTNSTARWPARGNRSNGCAYADSAEHVPIQRMPNVEPAAGSGRAATDALIAGRGGRHLRDRGTKSWSIDMQRFNFQFTWPAFHCIRAGRLAGQLRDAYQSTRISGHPGRPGRPGHHRLGGAELRQRTAGQVAAVSTAAPVPCSPT